MAKILSELYVKPEKVNTPRAGLGITLKRQAIPSHRFESSYNAEKFKRGLV